jgi:hypothetical protein
MTASFGKSPEPPVGQEPANAVRPEATLLAPPPAKKAYLKPALKRLGMLRSVTGSNLKW